MKERLRRIFFRRCKLIRRTWARLEPSKWPSLALTNGPSTVSPCPHVKSSGPANKFPKYVPKNQRQTDNNSREDSRLSNVESTILRRCVPTMDICRVICAGGLSYLTCMVFEEFELAIPWNIFDMSEGGMKGQMAKKGSSVAEMVDDVRVIMRTWPASLKPARNVVACRVSHKLEY